MYDFRVDFMSEKPKNRPLDPRNRRPTRVLLVSVLRINYDHDTSRLAILHDIWATVDFFYVIL